MLIVEVNDMESEWTLDCGAEANLIEEAECIRLGLTIVTTRQRAKWGDGKTWIRTIGEVHFTAKRGHHTLRFSGLVVRQGMDTPVLAGAPFLKINDLSINFRSQTIFLGDCCKVQYNNDSKFSRGSTTAAVMRVANKTCILPGDSVSFKLPEELKNKGPVAIEPRTTVPNDMPKWIRCGIVTPDSKGYIQVQNPTTKPVYLNKHTQVCQVRPTIAINADDDTSMNAGVPKQATKVKREIKPTQNSIIQSTNMLSQIKIDPSKILTNDDRAKFIQIHRKYKEVFSGEVGCYNGYSGKFAHVINMGVNLPPQRKGRIPVYDHKNKELLQSKLDDLLNAGVLSRAEDIGVPVEYVHPCFLVKKSSGGHRIVSPFGEVAEFARPQPTVTSNVEHVILQIGQWKHIIKCDLKSAYFQVPLSPESCRYVGVMTPFKGTFVYRRSVMGLPGSESALEELLSRIFGDMVEDRKIVKIADDFYVGSDNIENLLSSWEEVLQRLSLNGLKLSADKTVCCPTSTNILGWLWNQGTISASSHHVNALTVREPPTTVKGLRSYIGCFKFISRVLPNYAEKLQPLEAACGGQQSTDKVLWTEELLTAFNQSKDQLKKAKPVVLPKNDEQLHIITDAAVNCAGLAATLLVTRNGKPTVVSHFNASLRKNQAKLLPCEIEALAIGVAINHFSYYISQSTKRARVLTDSRPCVLSYKKLMRGEFSSSPKVTTFLTVASRYNVEIMHITGSNNIYTDFMSRNPVQCDQDKCQICQFTEETSISSVGEVRVEDIVSGGSKVPFASRMSWIGVQQACQDLQKVHWYIKSGATVPKKKRHMTEVRRYLNYGIQIASTPRGNLLVIKQHSPFKDTVERVVIPRKAADGLLTALHVQLDHPSAHQLKLVFSRAFFCLDMESKARKVVEGCYTCTSLKSIPNVYHKQSTSAPAETIGCRFSGDVIKRYCQNVLVIREDISSFTDAVLVDDETAVTLKEGVILLMSRLRSPVGPGAVIRTDPATALNSLTKNKDLARLNITVEIGEPKNVDHNPIAEKAVRELKDEMLRIKPLGGKLTRTELAQAVSRVNSRVRYSKLSAVEMFTSRDMTSGDQLKIDDQKLISDKQNIRESHHHASAKFKARGKEQASFPEVSVGDMVYIASDGSKLQRRAKYLITEVDDEVVKAQKFTENQFRNKEYEVKRSNILVIPKFAADNTETESDHYNKKRDVEPTQSQHEKVRIPIRNKGQCKVKPPDIDDPKHINQDDDTETDLDSDSDDELINVPSLSEAVQIHLDQSLAQIHPDQDTAEVRPARDRRPPEWMEDYTVLESDSDDENEEFSDVADEDNDAEVSLEEYVATDDGSLERVGSEDESQEELFVIVNDDDRQGHESLEDVHEEERRGKKKSPKKKKKSKAIPKDVIPNSRKLRIRKKKS